MSKYLPQWQDLADGQRFELDRLTATASALRLDLSDEAGQILAVHFSAPIGYRRLDEGDALTMLTQLAASGGTGKTFYEVEESDFLAWFHAQNGGIWEGRGLRHFTVATVNDVIDVLALEPPVLESHAPAAASAS